MMKRYMAMLLAAALLLSLCACSAQSPATTESDAALDMSAAQTAQNAASGESYAAILPAALTETAASAEPPADTAANVSTAAVLLSAEAEAEMFSSRDYDDSYENYTSVYLTDNASSSDSDVIVSGNTVTIKHEGCYLLSGSLSDGQLIIDAPDSEKIQLVFAGVSIHREGGPALYIAAADKVFLTLATGTENSLSSVGSFGVDGVDAALFARPDLSVNGEGRLSVYCESSHGIVGKDDIKITGGTLHVNAPAGKGIEGKDSLRIDGGSITVTSGKDGLQSEHDNAEKGFIYIKDGSLTITAGNDGLQATGPVTVRGGTLAVTSGGGYQNAAPHTESFGGRDNRFASAETTATTADSGVSDSFKGIKSDSSITVSGGSFTLNCADDALHTNGDMYISGGDFSVQSGDDALHADNRLEFSGGRLSVSVCYEGVEATDIVVSGGELNITSSDDGFNAAGGNDSSGFGPGMDRFAQATGSLAVTGGTIVLNTEGDSLDANGTLYVSGGSVTIAGPSWTGNGILDSDMGAAVYGGTVLASGVSGMQTNFGSYSTQGSMLLTLSATQPAGTAVRLYDAQSGLLLTEFAPAKDFSALLISTPAIVDGGSYTLVAGSETQSITMSGLLYGAGGGFGFGGGKGGRR